MSNYGALILDNITEKYYPHDVCSYPVVPDRSYQWTSSSLKNSKIV